VSDDYQKTPWIEIGAVWQKRDTSDGRVMFTGKLGNADLIVIGNDKKGNEKAPDLRVYVAKPQHEREQRTPRRDSTRGAPLEEPNPGTAFDYPPEGDTPF